MPAPRGGVTWKSEITSLSFPTTGKTDLIDITREVSLRVRESGISEGSVLIFVPGSTAALTTIEYESGVIEDLREAIARLAPDNLNYRHDARWGDGNGYSHVRAALLGPSLTIPVIEGKLVLGTWQQVILCDFDNRPRKRQVVVQVTGDRRVQGPVREGSGLEVPRIVYGVSSFLHCTPATRPQYTVDDGTDGTDGIDR